MKHADFAVPAFFIMTLPKSIKRKGKQHYFIKLMGTAQSPPAY